MKQISFINVLILIFQMVFGKWFFPFRHSHYDVKKLSFIITNTFNVKVLGAHLKKRSNLKM